MPLKDYLKQARQARWSLGQFNFSVLEQLKAIVFAAKKEASPLILGTSQKEAEFFGLEEAVALKNSLAKKNSISLFLHLDHGRDIAFIKKAVSAGYDSVHFDGSDLPFKKNLELAKKVVAFAHTKGVLVEAELGYLRGASAKKLEKTISLKKEDFTQPEQVEEFVQKTKIDSLAVAVGNVHGVYQRQPQLDFSLLNKISKNTEAFLVLHGGSGIASCDLKRAVKNGIQKVNINTEIRRLWRNELEKALQKSNSVKPYEILPPVIESLSELVRAKIKILNSKGKA